MSKDTPATRAALLALRIAEREAKEDAAIARQLVRRAEERSLSLMAAAQLIEDAGGARAAPTETVRLAYTLPEVAAMLAISESKAYQLAQSGAFGALLRVDRIVRVRAAALTDWIDAATDAADTEDSRDTLTRAARNARGSTRHLSV